MDIGTTIFLAKLIGVFSLVMGASMLKRNMMIEVFRELSRQRALSCVMGVLMLLIGLLVILVHTKWETIPATVITLLGWGVLLESTVFLFSSQEVVARYVSTLENKVLYYLITCGYFLLGLYLSYVGFVA